MNFATYYAIFVFPFHLREIHTAVVGLPSLLTLLILHRGTQRAQLSDLFSVIIFYLN